MTKTSAQDPRGVATRAALVRAACELIPEVGWGSVTTRAVAERAGVRSGLVHYHFDSLEGLLTAAVTQAAQGLADDIDRMLHATDDVDAGIDALVAGVTAVADEPALLLLTEGSLAASRIPALRATFAEVLADLRARIAAWLASHDHAGDPLATATVVAAAADGWALHRAADPALDPAPFREGLRAMSRPAHVPGAPS